MSVFMKEMRFKYKSKKVKYCEFDKNDNFQEMFDAK